MHQPFDDDEPIHDNLRKMTHDDMIAQAWCLVQEGFVDFTYDERTGLYTFTLNERGIEMHRRATEGEEWKQ